MGTAAVALLAGFGAISAFTLLGGYVGDRLADRDAFAVGIAVLLALLLGFLALALAGLASFLTALVVLAVAVVAVPLLLRYRFDVRSGGAAAFVGGAPVVVFLLLLAGFGVGWGWEYVVTAQEVPASAVDEAAVSFDEVPEVRDDLFAGGDCETDTEGRRTCYLQVRGYEHELAATRFLDGHGVRCPYQGGRSGDGRSLVARYDGRCYRVSCSPHGD